MKFTEFREILFHEAAVGKKKIPRQPIWWKDVGDVRWGMLFSKEPSYETFNLKLKYVPKAWISDDRHGVHHGFDMPIGRVIDLQEIRLELRYPGTADLLPSTLFDSLLDHNLAISNALRVEPRLHDIEWRKTDFRLFFDQLDAALDNLHTLDDLASALGCEPHDIDWLAFEKKFQSRFSN